MSLWHCVELCKLSLPLILKCLGMLPLITYKHSNSLPAPCPCFHKPWLAYHLSNSETLLEMTLLTKVIARKTTTGLACLAAHLEVTLTHDWDWEIYGRLSWRITEVPLLVYNPWLWMDHLTFGSGQEAGNNSPHQFQRTKGELEVPELCCISSCICTHKGLGDICSTGTWQHGVLLFLQKGKENFDQINLISFSYI